MNYIFCARVIPPKNTQKYQWHSVWHYVALGIAGACFGASFEFWVSMICLIKKIHKGLFVSEILFLIPQLALPFGIVQFCVEFMFYYPPVAVFFMIFTILIMLWAVLEIISSYYVLFKKDNQEVTTEQVNNNLE